MLRAVLSAALVLLALSAQASVRIYNSPTDKYNVLAYEIINEPCFPIEEEPFARSCTFFGEIRIPDRKETGHFHVLTIHPYDGVQVWSAGAEPNDRRVISAWGTVPTKMHPFPALMFAMQIDKRVIFDFTVEKEAHFPNQSASKPIDRGLGLYVPAEYASIVTFRPETGRHAECGDGHAQMTIWASPVQPWTLKGTTKGFTRAGQAETSQDNLDVPIAADIVGLPRDHMWFSGPECGFGHILIKGYVMI